jgi:hypothetical protein
MLLREMLCRHEFSNIRHHKYFETVHGARPHYVGSSSLSNYPYALYCRHRNQRSLSNCEHCIM